MPKMQAHHCELDRDDKTGDESRVLLTASSAGNAMVTYSVVLVEVNGIKCRALLDTAGVGSSYASQHL